MPHDEGVLAAALARLSAPDALALLSYLRTWLHNHASIVGLQDVAGTRNRPREVAP